MGPSQGDDRRGRGREVPFPLLSFFFATRCLSWHFVNLERKNIPRQSQIKRRRSGQSRRLASRASRRKGDTARVNGPWMDHSRYLKLAPSVNRKSSSRIVFRCEGQPNERGICAPLTQPPHARPPGQNGPYKPFIVIDRQIDDNKGPAAGCGGSPPTPRTTTAADCRPLTERRAGTEGLTRQ